MQHEEKSEVLGTWRRLRGSFEMRFVAQEVANGSVVGWQIEEFASRPRVNQVLYHMSWPIEWFRSKNWEKISDSTELTG